MKNTSAVLRLSALSLALGLGLSACGGSDSSDSATTTGNTGNTGSASNTGGSATPTPVAEWLAAADRIEPLDTANSQRLSLVSRAQSRLPLGQPVTQIALDALPADALQAATLNPARGKGKTLRTGVGRALPATATAQDLAGQLRFATLADGSQVAALRFSAEGARGLRLGLLATRLPAGAVLRFYSPGGAVHEVSAQTLAARPDADSATFWSPTTEGDTTVLEVQLPAGSAPADLQLAVPRLSHLVQHMSDLQADVSVSARNLLDVGDAGACNTDAMCRADLDAERRAIVKLEITDSSGATGVCSGTLLNDSRASRTPYVLTAEHCVGSSAEAQSVQSYWFFHSSACGSNSASSAMRQQSGGAELLTSSLTLDSSLLRMNQAAPSGVVFAGSYFGSASVQGRDVLAMHFPSGDLARYSLGQVPSYAYCTLDDRCSDDAQSGANRLRVDWTQGVTEGGSSGSGLFVQSGSTRYLVGALSGGESSCANPRGADFYGRFDQFFSRFASTWLQP